MKMGIMKKSGYYYPSDHSVTPYSLDHMRGKEADRVGR